MVLKDFANELVGDIPGLSYFRAVRCVQRAWHDIRDARMWSFLVSEGVLVSPPQITDGTVSVTQYSDQVVADAAAGEAWIPAVLPMSGVDMTKRQFRLPGGPIYGIKSFTVGVNGATWSSITGTWGDVEGNWNDVGGGVDSFILTLDRPYQEADSASTGYIIYRCYFPAPSEDFLRWVSFVDPLNKYRIRKPNLHHTRAELDRRDPYRGSFGLPVWLSSYKVNSDGLPLFEPWPHPNYNVGFVVMYSRRGDDLTPSEQLPSAISEELLMSGSRIKAYAWAAANSGRVPELQAPAGHWMALRSQEEKAYQQDLNRHKLLDEETFSQNFMESEQDYGLSGPVDAAYFQSHDVFAV